MARTQKRRKSGPFARAVRIPPHDAASGCDIVRSLHEQILGLVRHFDSNPKYFRDGRAKPAFRIKLGQRAELLARLEAKAALLTQDNPAMRAKNPAKFQRKLERGKQLAAALAQLKQDLLTQGVML